MLGVIEKDANCSAGNTKVELAVNIKEMFEDLPSQKSRLLNGVLSFSFY